MVNKQPLVSVIIPAYNCEDYIHDAVKSIMDQTYRNLEIIVVDDASTDKTGGIVKRLQSEDARIKIITNQVNLKLVGGLNKAIEASKGEYIARMDADDYKHPDAIEKQVNYLLDNPDTVVVGGAINVCDEHMNVLNHRSYPATDSEIRNRMFRYNPFAHPAVMINRALIGDERYELAWAEDYDMWFRLGKKGKLANIPSTVLNLRTHSSSVSQSKVAYQEDLTLYIRLKAIFEYGYTMSPADKGYFFAQLVGTKVIPSAIKFRLFSFLRGRKKQ